MITDIRNTITDEEWESIKEKLPESINEIYRIGCAVVQNSSCLLMEDLIDYTTQELKKQFKKLEKEYELLEMSLSILRRKLELQQEQVNLCIEYDDIEKIDTIKPSDAKNIAELLNKSLKPLRDVTEGIERMELVKDVVKISKKSLKNS